MLIVLFDDPALNGFKLRYNVIPSPGAAGSTGFTMHLKAIPKPADAILLALGASLASYKSRKPA